MSLLLIIKIIILDTDKIFRRHFRSNSLYIHETDLSCINCNLYLQQGLYIYDDQGFRF